MFTRQTRIWITVGLISFGLMLAGYLIGERQGLLAGLLLALGINFLIYHYTTQHWIEYFKATEIEGQDPWNLLAMTRDISVRARIPKPQVYLIKSDFPTAFSVGKSVKSSSIIVSEGLLKYFTLEEQEAVIACEMSKIRRLDILNLGLISGLTAPLFIFCKLLDATLTFLSFGLLKNKKIFNHLCIRLMELIARPIIGQKGCFESDYHAAQLLKSPEQLAKTLWKLKSYATTRKLEIPAHAAPFLTVNPLTSGQTRYFHIQPSVDERIEKLVGRFPI